MDWNKLIKSMFDWGFQWESNPPQPPLAKGGRSESESNPPQYPLAKGGRSESESNPPQPPLAKGGRKGGGLQNLKFTQFFSPYRFGMPQQSGAMTVLPLFGAPRRGKFVAPLSGLKLSRVDGYGNMEITNPSEAGIAIIPLHMGYIQDGAQNHALCRSAFLAPGQKLMFEDACCVQESQGGYLEGREQWFFILPLQLRWSALQLRGKKELQ